MLWVPGMTHDHRDDGGSERPLDRHVRPFRAESLLVQVQPRRVRNSEPGNDMPLPLRHVDLSNSYQGARSLLDSPSRSPACGGEKGRHMERVRQFLGSKDQTDEPLLV